jgi:hypothetical protein
MESVNAVDRFDGDAFREACEALRGEKRQALTDALAALERAAWARQWAPLQVARQEIERLTWVTITGPLRHELEALVTNGVSGD